MLLFLLCFGAWLLGHPNLSLETMAIPWVLWHHSAVSSHMACFVACCGIATSILQAVSSSHQLPKPSCPLLVDAREFQ